jgi:glutamyl-tRNA synthetase
LLKEFDLSRVNPNPAHYDITKLRAYNGQWMQRLSTDDLAERAAAYLGQENNDNFKEAILASRERAKTLAEIDSVVGYIWNEPRQDAKAARKFLKPEHQETLAVVLEKLESSKEWSAETLEKEMMQIVEEKELKAKDVFQPIRVALTGKTFSPPIGETISLLQKETALRRIRDAIAQ